MSETLEQIISCKVFKYFKNSFFNSTLPVAASVFFYLPYFGKELEIYMVIYLGRLSPNPKKDGVVQFDHPCGFSKHVFYREDGALFFMTWNIIIIQISLKDFI